MACSLTFERRVLQSVIAVLALVPIVAGLAGATRGLTFMTALPQFADVDSHFRYLSGLLLAIGLSYWRIIPTIEEDCPEIRLLTTLVVAGGLVRLFALAQAGPVGKSTVVALVMELVVTPLLALWQSRLHRAWMLGLSPSRGGERVGS